MTHPRNILFLTTDQHRFDAFGFMPGDWNVQTPNFDRLAAEGTVFGESWSNCPVCTPCRFTWCHALYAGQGSRGVVMNAAGWPTGLPSLPGVLRERGWRTALVGKLHAHEGRHRDLTDPAHVAETHGRGFTDVWEVGGRSMTHHIDCNYTHRLAKKGLLEAYRADIERRRADRCWNEPYAPSVLPPGDHLDAVIADKAIAWLEGYDDDRPFFLHCSLCGPHFPLDPPEGWFGRHRPADMPPPVAVDDPVEAQYWQEQRAAYADLIGFVDHQVGRVLGALDRCGLADDTLVVLTTDHGDRIGDQGWWHKSQPQDASARTPTFVRLPGVVPAGVVRDELVEAVDIPVSLLRAAGIDDDIDLLIPESPGRSWWDLVQGEGDPIREDAFSECGTWNMVVTPEWKYVRYRDGTELLSDRAADPYDLRSLHDDPACAGTLTAMRARLIDRLNQRVAPNRPGYWRDRAMAQAEKAKRERPERIPKVPTTGF